MHRGRSARAALPRLEDSGLGVPVDERAQVFVPFRQAAGAQRVKGAGAGLGLALVRHIPSPHGVAIMLGNSPPGGHKASETFPASACG